MQCNALLTYLPASLIPSDRHPILVRHVAALTTPSTFAPSFIVFTGGIEFLHTFVLSGETIRESSKGFPHTRQEASVSCRRN